MTVHVDRSLVSFAEARKLLPRSRDKPIHLTTLHRWRTRGVAGIRLWAVKVGARWYTSEDAIRTFIERLSSLRALPPKKSETALKADLVLKSLGF
jgi:hypothetical protein